LSRFTFHVSRFTSHGFHHLPACELALNAG
jgi:hypothetical protein